MVFVGGYAIIFDRTIIWLFIVSFWIHHRCRTCTFSWRLCWLDILAILALQPHQSNFKHQVRYINSSYNFA